ncbi:nucleotidyltransferase family protein [Curtobacterium flaccumfaciens]|uniref:nucleotidyltransferase family protein n=1 Tax=Curtobacterium flaccumfaciens TaxID=2035 RepID=UPI001BDDE49B|nr:nucleotidyltransferase domain-containing protein [Curtobacterium flaccumfaciens pv. betae]MBT1657022.1 nucleotidyltransferase domain-containing protein [Curtobacterium flaccumfaciens pv. betae]
MRGQDTEHSDIDLLVHLTPAASLFDLGGFAHEVERITGFEVDVSPTTSRTTSTSPTSSTKPCRCDAGSPVHASAPQRP